jgi:hypothetical protein
MATVTTPLAEKAESIFADMGYAVSRTGRKLRAERKWRVVHVTLEEDPAAVADDTNFQCFVTWHDRASAVRDQVTSTDPDYEWAVIGVDESGEYEVYRSPERTLT